MPTYEYECRECGHSFERTQSMSEDAIKDCPLCGQSVRRLIFGGAGVIFKGSGFYVNDSKGKKTSSSPVDKKSAEAGAGLIGTDKSGADKSGTDKSGVDKSSANKAEQSGQAANAPVSGAKSSSGGDPA
ncbi:MAG: hypothetical protein A2087_12930 [Spirochaetes bacterium GWD1_61_31]|nr:MAG: hypothetical protein A2Y37_05605 [Spirochaetes bacterium GWB1_60_80]OHD34393.1 MAG: hypothetical protein A2004_06960 [Spirochaetes bacterium GWC1_61_12]OHD35619.1 MAG: hypothetical protein A2087_12930 [Spirochaetes bacterium GWD1_61_31]OHD41657.1 MAG: hypothetical protein A2Y35_08945 [Spirochaetes bacterium GWE1_60_18]OHD61682.1 MAG: hypothetical protein A2Y32_03065 [Spirochaetes bacterium GWF1_60_12]HAP42899.1 FmdB family transcriptional regulator [Spirochaetaceae bacterium]